MTSSGLLRFSLTSVLLASASIGAIETAHAQYSISTAITTPVGTAGVNNGANDDVTITSTGSITLSSGATAPGALVLNSNNSVENDGAITVDDTNNVSGILAAGGYNGATIVTITNTDTISVTDSTPATTLDLNGSLTNGTARFGIFVQGTTPLIGSIVESGGTISVLGNNSAAVFIQPGLTGGISLAGTTTLTGIDGYGLQISGPIQGISNTIGSFSAGISITGNVTAFGQGSSAVAIGGPVTSGLYVDSTVQSNAYYSGGQDTARPVTPLAGFVLSRNGEQGGPALIVGANVGGGIELDTSAIVTSLGSAPALVVGAQVGGATAISAGPSGYGIVVNGSASINANGIYDGISANTIQVGGELLSNSNPNALVLGGGATAITGGIGNLGNISAIAYAANATTLSYQAGATTTSLTNFGTITAAVNFGYNGVTGGVATVISDSAGALDLVRNYGTIAATSANGGTIAMDLRGNTTGVTVLQLPSGATTPSSITGDIYFGSGNGNLDLESGTLVGAVSFGSGGNAFTLNNGAQATGAITEAGGTINLSVLNGRLVDTSLSNLALSALKIGASGEIDFDVDPAHDTAGGLTVEAANGSAGVGAVIISSGAKIGLDFDSKLTSPETLTLVQANSAGALIGQSSILVGNVPYFYVANLTTNLNTGAISVGLSDRSFAAAGVPGNAAAYNAIFNAFDRDSGIFNTFNSAVTQHLFKDVYQQVLPSYSGGLFEMLSEGASALVDAQANNPIVQRGDRSGAWAQQIGFGSTQNSSESPGYYGGGLGFAFGWEDPISSISSIGYSVGYMRGAVTNENAGPGDQEIGTAYTAGVYWRETDGNFHANAGLNAGIVAMNSTRNFAGAYFESTSFTRNATSRWTGGMGQAHVGVDYEQDLGEDFYVKPGISGDYFVLYEGAHGDHNGGSGLDLNYASAVGKQGSATGSLTFGTKVGEGFIWKPELTVGYKEVFGGPDDTVADFASGGSSFSLSAPSQKSGPMAKIGIHGGDKYTDIAFEAGGEDRGDYKAVTGQLVARFNF